MENRIFTAPDIVCDHCAHALEDALAVPGVRRVEVDIERQEVRVDYEGDRVDPADLAALMARAGYPVNLGASEAATAKTTKGGGCCGGGACHV